MKMAEARPPMLEALHVRLIKLNSDFIREKENFRDILKQLDSCLRLGLSSEKNLFDWLEGLIAQEKLMVVHGFLAILYFRYGPVEPGRPHLEQAQNFFPDEGFWVQTMLDEIYDEFDDLRSSRPS
jgi:hypothetical protein